MTVDPRLVNEDLMKTVAEGRGDHIGTVDKGSRHTDPQYILSSVHCTILNTTDCGHTWNLTCLMINFGKNKFHKMVCGSPGVQTIF